jgi:hypothetical protein
VKVQKLNYVFKAGVCVIRIVNYEVQSEGSCRQSEYMMKNVFIAGMLRIYLSIVDVLTLERLVDRLATSTQVHCKHEDI